MARARIAIGISTLILAVAIGCSRQSASTTSPSSVPAPDAAAGPGGITLKAAAPTPTSPVGGVKLTSAPVTLTVTNAAMLYTNLPLSYRFELQNASGAVVESQVVAGGQGTTSRTVAAALDGEKTYQWRARAEYQGTFGPWSALQSFIAPMSEGYIKSNEIYDPLTRGKTVGQISGPVTFIPGVGMRLDSVGSFVTYNLSSTVTEGEFSILFTNVTTIPEPILRRLISMREGTFQINDNRYRMTVGADNNGEFDWRFITGDTYVKTEGDAQRPKYPFKANLTYFLKATWRNNHFHVLYKEGGVDGTVIYDFGKDYQGVYSPNPHNVYLGSPFAPGDRGQRVSCANAVIRQVWMSPNARPPFANQ